MLLDDLRSLEMWRNNHCSPEFNGIWKAQCKQWFPIMPKEGLEHCLMSPELNIFLNLLLPRLESKIAIPLPTPCCCSVTQSCPTLWDPTECSTPSFPVLYQFWSLPEFMSIASVTPSSHLILWALFSFCLQSFPASGTFPMSWRFASDDQNTGVSASVL